MLVLRRNYRVISLVALLVALKQLAVLRVKLLVNKSTVLPQPASPKRTIHECRKQVYVNLHLAIAMRLIKQTLHETLHKLCLPVIYLVHNNIGGPKGNYFYLK